MKTIDPNEIIPLILADILGNLDEDSRVVIEGWLAESEENRILYRRIRDRENYRRFRLMAGEHDYEINYQRFQEDLHTRRRHLVFRRIGYAAAVLVMLLAVPLVWNHQREDEAVAGSEMYGSTLRPGASFAVLTLSDGKKLSLDSCMGQRTIEPGVVVASQVLEYDGRQSCGSQHRLSVPDGCEYSLRLSDGSRVWLNAGSELEYPSRFDGSQRQVVMKGEAYFEISADSTRPFVVRTEHHRVRVLGTSFGIRAYEDEGKILTTLEQGKVEVCTGKDRLTLKPGEQAVNDVSHNTLMSRKVKTLLYTAWHKGRFLFEEQPLEEIMNTLSRWYAMDVYYTEPGLRRIRFTGELKRYGRIEDFLERIGHLEVVRFRIDGNKVIVSKF